MGVECQLVCFPLLVTPIMVIFCLKVVVVISSTYPLVSARHFAGSVDDGKEKPEVFRRCMLVYVWLYV